MNGKISPRIANFVDALPLRLGLRVLEIGCGPGVAAREVSRRIDGGTILAIDRSAKAIKLAMGGSIAEIESGRLAFRQVAIEDFELQIGEAPFDIAFAMRVGALDGRHPELGNRALMRLKAALKPNGLLFVDNPNPIRRDEINA